MSFWGTVSSRHGVGGLDQVGLFCYEERRYRWIYAPHVALVSRPRLAGVASFLRIFPAHAVFIASVFIFFFWVEGSVEKEVDFYG